MADHRQIDDAVCRTIEIDLTRIFREYDTGDTVTYKLLMGAQEVDTLEAGGAKLTIDESKLTIDRPMAEDPDITNDTGVEVTVVAFSSGDPSTKVRDTFNLFSYEIRNRPLWTRRIPNQTKLRAGEIREFNLNSYWQASGINRPDDPCVAPNDELFYEVTKGADTAEIAADGHTLIVTGKDEIGTTIVEVTATNTFNQTPLASRPFTFNVMVDRLKNLPIVSAAIPEQVLSKGESGSISLSSHFRDPDGGALTYTVRRLSGTVGDVSVSGSTLNIEAGDDIGVSGWRVVATDSADQTVGTNFTMRVRNRAPVVVEGGIGNRTVYIGQKPITVALSDIFSDPDGDELTFYAARAPGDPTDFGVVTLADGVLTIGPTLDAGRGRFVVSAVDTSNARASSAFNVVVANSDPPTITNHIGDARLGIGMTRSIDLGNVFADNDMLTYTVSRDPSDTGTVGDAVITAQGTLEMVAGTTQGKGIFVVRATDQSGQFVEDRYALSVGPATNVSPTIADAVEDFNLERGKSRSINIARVFADDSGTLQYSVTRSGGTATHVLNGDILTITAGNNLGPTTFTVTATDPGNLKSTDSFVVTVIPVIVASRPPTIENAIEDRNLEVGSRVGYNLHNVFRNNKPGSNLTFAVAADRGDRATSDLQGSMLTIEADANGPTTFTVTATNSDGNVQDRFVITGVHAPTVVGSIGEVNVVVRGERSVDLSAIFTDATSGEVLTYTVQRAASDTSNIAGARIDGNLLIAEGGTRGGTGTFVVTATDQTGNSVTHEFTIKVNTGAPRASQNFRDVIKSITFNRNASRFDLDDYFNDPTGETLTFRHEVTGDAVAMVTIATGNVLTVTPNGMIGTATIKAIAEDPDGFTAEQEFDYTVIRAPILQTQIPDQTLLAGLSRTIDLDDHFEHPEEITYSVRSLSAAAGTATVSGSMLTLTAAAAGGTSGINVVARVGSESTSDNFVFRSIANRRPQVRGTGIPDRVVALSESQDITLSDYFTDPDLDSGDVLTFTVENTPSDGITATISEGKLTVTAGSSAGTSDVTIRATDLAGLFIEDTFSIRVSDAPMIRGDGIPDQSLVVGTSRNLNLATYFSDNDTLVYTVTRGTGTAGTATVNGSTLELTGGNTRGDSSFTVRATDEHGLFVEDTFELAVSNADPTVSTQIPNQTAKVGAAVIRIDLGDHFSDADNHPLTYTVARAAGDSGSISTARVVGSILELTPGNDEGTSTWVVTARDAYDGVATDEFTFVVSNTQPVLSTPIPNQRIGVGGASRTLNLSDYFTDADAHTLTYTVQRAATDPGTIGSVRVSGTDLILTPGNDQGSGIWVVIADDGFGGNATATFTLTVSNVNPRVTTAIPNQVLATGGGDKVIDLTQHFVDDDGQPITYTVSRASGTVASATINGSNLTLSPGDTDGQSSWTVTARDPFGGVATDSFVLVVNDAPVFALPASAPGVGLGTSDPVNRETVNLGQYFTDPNNHALTYSVVRRSANNAVSASIDNQRGTLHLSAPRNFRTDMTFTIRATDTVGDFVEGTIRVIARPTRRFHRISPIPAQRAAVDTSDIDLGVTVTGLGVEPYVLSVTRVSGTAGSARISGTRLILTPGSTTGQSTFRLNARDVFGVNSEGNTIVTLNVVASVSLGTPIPDQVRDVRRTAVVIDLSEHFDSAAALTYTVERAASDTGGVGTAEVLGATLTLTPGNTAGDSTWLVTADNGAGVTATDEFKFTVSERRSPTVVGTGIPNSRGVANANIAIELSQYFSDPGDDLTYSVARAASDTGSIGTATVVGSRVTLATGANVGRGTFVVTATDLDSNTVTDEFHLAVTAGIGRAARIGSLGSIGTPQPLAAFNGKLYLGVTRYLQTRSPGTIYTVDVSTGGATAVRGLAFSSRSVDGLAELGGVLYMGSRFSLISVDVDAGTINSITPVRNNNPPIEGMAAIGDTMYVVSNGGTNVLNPEVSTESGLYTMDVSTGMATRVGSATNFGAGEFLNVDGLVAIGNSLYMSVIHPVRGAIYRVNPTTGVATRTTGPAGFGVDHRPAFGGTGETQPYGLALFGDTVYMAGRETNALYELDLGGPVSFPIPDQTLAISATKDIDLSPYFLGAGRLAYTATTSSSNLTVSIQGTSTLRLQETGGTAYDATVTVRATQAGALYAEETFALKVS